LDQIDDEAVRADGDLTVALRRCLSLGGQIRSTALRDWANLELKGYNNYEQDLPDYRQVIAPLMIDGADIVKSVTGQQISSNQLPDVVREYVTETLDVRQGVGELDDLIRTTRADGGLVVNLSPPGSADIVRIMNVEMGKNYSEISRLYWQVHVSVLVGVLDSIRVKLVELVAEIRAGQDESESLDGERANDAVNFVISGDGNRVNYQPVQTTGGSTVSTNTSLDDHADSKGWGWKAWSLLIGVATLLALGLTIFMLKN